MSNTFLIDRRKALLAYWANLFLLGAVVYAIWAYACTTKLVKPGKKNLATYKAFQRRIIQATTLYAVGLTFCYFGTIYSIVFMLLVQLNNAIAPKFTARFTA